MGGVKCLVFTIGYGTSTKNVLKMTLWLLFSFLSSNCSATTVAKVSQLST